MRQAARKTPQLPRPPHVFYGWRLVGVTIFTLALLNGTSFQSIGTFFVTLERQRGWSRTMLSAAFSLGRAEGAMLGPIEGFLTDRLGSRRMVLIGFAIMGSGFVILSFVQSLPIFYAAFLVIFAGAGFAGFFPLMTAINHWFRRLKTTAMALALMGNSLAGLVVLPLTWAVISYGWQTTALFLGLALWALAVPIALIVRNRPEEYGLRPDGDSPSDPSTAEDPTHEAEEDDSFTLGEAVRTPALWLITLAHGLGGAPMAFAFVHIIPHLTDRGLSLPTAAAVVTTFTLTGVVSQLITGFIGDRFPKPPLIAICLALQAVGLLIAVIVFSAPMAFLFAIVFGFGSGGRMALLTALRGEYFGREAFATIFGFTQLPMNLLWMITPVLAGYLFDTTGSYTLPFLALALSNVVGAILILPVRKPTPPTSRQRRSELDGGTSQRAGPHHV